MSITSHFQVITVALNSRLIIPTNKILHIATWEQVIHQNAVVSFIHFIKLVILLRGLNPYLPKDQQRSKKGTSFRVGET